MRNPEGYAGFQKSQQSKFSGSLLLYVMAFIIGYNFKSVLTRYREIQEEDRIRENRKKSEI